MDIVKDNWKKELPNFSKAIHEASFVAIDFEFSGLQSNPSQHHHPIDNPQERYTKVRSSVMEFLPLQLGICPFIWDNENAGWIAQPFNIYLFPLTSRTQGYDKTFSIQASAVEFLLSNGFDFNKAFEQGVSYLTPFHENRLKSKLAQRSATTRDSADMVIEDEYKEYVEISLKMIDDWLQNSTEKVLLVPAKNSFYRRMIHQEVKKKYNSFLSTEGKDTHIEVQKLTEELKREKLEQSEQKLYESEEFIENAIGIRKVIDILIEAKKPLVGHNMFTDCLYLLHHFCVFLPEDINEFKQEMQKRFPILIDTKYLSTYQSDVAGLVNGTALSCLYDRVLKSPFLDTVPIKFHEKHGHYEGDDDMFHEAGYDAYCTGVAFARMMAYIASRKEVSNDSTSTFVLPDFISELSNKLFIMRSDIPFINMNGPEASLDRHHIFYMSAFPYYWKQRDIQAIIEPEEFGQVQVKWIDDTSLFLIFDKGLISTKGVAYILNLFRDMYPSSSNYPTPLPNPPVIQEQNSSPTEVEEGEIEHTEVSEPDVEEVIICELGSQSFKLQSYNSWMKLHQKSPQALDSNKKRRRVD